MQLRSHSLQTTLISTFIKWFCFFIKCYDQTFQNKLLNCLTPTCYKTVSILQKAKNARNSFFFQSMNTCQDKTYNSTKIRQRCHIIIEELGFVFSIFFKLLDNFFPVFFLLKNKYLYVDIFSYVSELNI